jgi:hypothetical protein
MSAPAAVHPGTPALDTDPDDARAALADLDALVYEVGASYPLLAYVTNAEETYEDETALDPIILAALVTP